jgi:hypothetical protein
MHFDDGESRAQYAVLHLDSSFLRLCPTRDSGWGTSIVLLPCLWSGGLLFQGAGVAVHWEARGRDLVLAARGRIGLIDVDLDVRINPPESGHLSAEVRGRAIGTMPLDRREGEAFRLVTLSSMRIGERQWDAKSAYADDRAFALGEPGWTVAPEPRVLATRFGLVGGSSEWKPRAPTVEVELGHRHRIVGWLTRSSDPSGDNVSLWAATPFVARAWRYTIHASRAT